MDIMRNYGVRQQNLLNLLPVCVIIFLYLVPCIIWELNGDSLMLKKLRGSILLLITAVIWGTAFVAQSEGMNYVDPFTYNAVRTLIGGFVLIPVIASAEAAVSHPAFLPMTSTMVTYFVP